MSDSPIPMDRLVKIYRRIRSEIAAVTQEYDTKLEGLKAQQDEVADAMKEQMKALGVTSVRTAEGTAVLAVKKRYDTQDWDSFKSFIMEHNALDLLEKRIAQRNMAQFLEENPGVVPPGLNSSSSYDVSVRKPTN